MVTCLPSSCSRHRLADATVQIQAWCDGLNCVPLKGELKALVPRTSDTTLSVNKVKAGVISYVT